MPGPPPRAPGQYGGQREQRRPRDRGLRGAEAGIALGGRTGSGPGPKWLCPAAAATGTAGSGRRACATWSAAAASTRPWPRPSSRPPAGLSEAVSSSSFLIWAGDSSGWAALTRATAPETKAAAALVPQPS